MEHRPAQIRDSYTLRAAFLPTDAGTRWIIGEYRTVNPDDDRAVIVGCADYCRVPGTRAKRRHDMDGREY